MDEPVVKKITALVRMLGSPNESEAMSALLALRRYLPSNGLDVHVIADRFEHGGSEPLTAAELQQVYDAAYQKAFADGVKQGRRSAVLAGAQPIRTFGASVGDGVNGYTWLQIAEHCLINKHLFHGRDLEFVESVAEQLTHRDPSQPQAKWLRNLFMRKFGGKIT
jgi:hypothetical protein